MSASDQGRRGKGCLTGAYHDWRNGDWRSGDDWRKIGGCVFAQFATHFAQ